MRARTTGLVLWTVIGCTSGRLNIGPDGDPMESYGTIPSTSSDTGARASIGGTSSIGSSNIGASSGIGAAGSSSSIDVSPGCAGALEETLPINNGYRCVAKMVTIAGPTSTASYRIDATEVTRGQYAAWLATNPPLPPSTDVTCGWKAGAEAKGFAPDTSCMSQAEVCHTNCAQHPQVCVDWCDAYSYCASTGKRLCGAIGGGSSTLMDHTNAENNQWYRACSSAGANDYPYGDTYDGKRCNGYDYWGTSANGTTVPVGSLTDCQSTVLGFTGVYDLSGNTREWVDSCSSLAGFTTCILRGGALNDSGGESSYLSCSGGDGAPPNATGRAGFRCCSDER